MGSVYVKDDGTSYVIWMKTKQNKATTTKPSTMILHLSTEKLRITAHYCYSSGLSTLTRAKTHFIREDPYYDDCEFHNAGTDNQSVNKDYLLVRVCVFVFACA